MTARPDDAVAAPAPSRGEGGQASARRDQHCHRVLVIVAAGSGTRLGHGAPKAAVKLSSRTILEHALDAVTPELGFELIVLVLPEDPAHHQTLAVSGTALAHQTRGEVVITTGGSSRTDSVLAGTQAVQEHAQLKGWGEPVHVLVHDAARALTPAAVFSRVLEALDSGAEAVTPAVPVADTIKQVSPVPGIPSTSPQNLETDPARKEAGTDLQERVERTLARSTLRAVQTPQGFTLEFLNRAFAHIQQLPAERAAQLTDEAMIAEDLDVEVAVVPGDSLALKITTETDLVTARALLAENEGGSSGPSGTPQPPRVGIGQDIHAFAPADEPTELWVAGLCWPGQQGLAGHSDADPVAHAACAALFSAAGLGDLGTHFGADTLGTHRAETKGARGVVLLAEAARIVREAGFRIGSISVQMVANQPKFSPRREEAQRVLSAAAGVPVSVAATTSDGLGFTGRGEGIAATATAVLY
ncbi:2-C-methyl-D-erythritol 2,4-cyclodiphosphate synthase [Nesterenkonia ebinurensis]|uniref:2-C-methyl-D-erythritol 2,4-cyclodiphosphate synthase n=1 Tax=Nesterenkonia ebinurensis TaxID=2608252 RepID=UPI00123E42C5|nr:2-C-methyl-D-erythritol 2,4-cyclodiphosphate synthase [Nesterenkonia ebinurensis]